MSAAQLKHMHVAARNPRRFASVLSREDNRALQALIRSAAEELCG